MDGETSFHCVEDVVSGETCCFFRGRDRTAVDDSYRSIEGEVDAWSHPELLQEIYSDIPALEKVGAIFRFGIGAPPEFDQDYFEAFSIALRDENPMIRAAVVRTASYMEWPDLLRDLRTSAVNDSDMRVRGEARKVIEAFERVGIRES
ncbi:HEAT repeat domain-containing protein [Streptomyces litchfieldiae]|uniref:HEAT repeat domain-containing protein n=1 Tax=Streptomyces litchfieldiae TaxID=3075543 RepID=A0ABU2MNR0_9ACTN|nr:HEAT repeat domain-containing protein [Streptomyces sp. DSM 44938]MDT0343195.1 HEAT repeat domain-containing protein [Streptomyces sp. DSM 44938]